MSGRPTTFRAALALVALSAALSGALWHGYAGADPVEPAPVTEAHADIAFPASARTAGSIPIDAWTATALARPLFASRRRPDAGGSQQMVAGLPHLTGVLVWLDERLAFFVDPAGGKPQVVREGGTIGAHIVKSIRPGEAILTGPRGQHVLHPGFQ